jgi:MarR family 2-MHQ and catechol resistance regulon transcriptional repressor
LGKAFQAAAKYLYAGLEETGIDDTNFRILEALLNKGPLAVNTIGPKVHLTPGSISTAVDRRFFAKHAAEIRRVFADASPSS